MWNRVPLLVRALLAAIVVPEIATEQLALMTPHSPLCRCDLPHSYMDPAV